MLSLTNKTILLISPQYWGSMFVSKHHYALELARAGNTVFFLNPPEEKKTSDGRKIRIEQSEIHEDLFFIHHRLSFPYDIKFHFIGLFHKLMKPHIKKLLSQIAKPVDIVWSFDLGNLYCFDFFPETAVKIFHPVDEPLNEAAIRSARGADFIFSVTQEILDKYKRYPVPLRCINHGISEEFIHSPGIYRPSVPPFRVGMSGNLLRSDIDRETLLSIISDHSDIIFECWGSYRLNQSNLGGIENEGLKNFIQTLEGMQNVILHGPVPASFLAKEFQRMDAFLICYDIKKDQSRGTNYHKVLEYISTGKVVIANNITAYEGLNNLVMMTTRRDNNEELPALFNRVIQQPEICNSETLFNERRAFALNNSYKKQIARIASILGEDAIVTEHQMIGPAH